MSTNRVVVAAPPERVWEVLADGWLYPLWVVGAARMREVDDHWPAVGSRLHHSVGSWPLMLDDDTLVLEVDPGRRIVMQARGWPFGSARVEIDVHPHPEGSEVVLHERADGGPGRLVPSALHDPPLLWRNRESLRRLSFVVENRATVSA